MEKLFPKTKEGNNNDDETSRKKNCVYLFSQIKNFIKENLLINLHQSLEFLT